MKTTSTLFFLVFAICANVYFVNAQVNNALNFDGVNDYVNINKTLGNFRTSDFTVASLPAGLYYLKNNSTQEVQKIIISR